jgi:hypothetical protein
MDNRGGVIDAGAHSALTVRDAAVAMLESLSISPRLIPIPVGAARLVALTSDRLRGSRWTEQLSRFAENRSVDARQFEQRSGIVARDFADGVRDQVREMFSPRHE